MVHRLCPTHGRRGFALLSALWLMMMLSGLGLHIAVEAHNTSLAAANRLETARTRAGADAGVAHAKSRLMALLRPADDGRTRRHAWVGVDHLVLDTVALGQVWYAVRLRDVGAHLNINVAPEGALRDLMVALRLDAGLADRAAQAIVDWRDADDLRLPRGAERDEYLKSGAPLLPTNGPFAHVEELRDVRGVSESVFELLRPFVTVDGSGLINPNSAGRPVLLSIPGFSPAIVSEIERLRATGVIFSSADQLTAALAPGTRNRALDTAAEWRPRLVFETREVEFEITAWMKRSPVRTVTRGTFVRAGQSILTSARRTE